MRNVQGLEDRWEQYRKVWRRSFRMAQILEGTPLPVDTLALTSTYVLAPAIGSFVEWVLYEAVKSGKKRLYFLARDGYFPWRAALIFCEEYRLPIECRYLCCSRYSLRLPIFHLDRKAALEYVCRGGIDVTMEKILRRAGLTEEERGEVLRSVSLPFAPKEILPYAALAEIRHRLGECALFLAHMDRHSRGAMPGLAGYLRQEGLLEDAADAVVDSGWVGSMQKTLQDVLTFMGRTRRLEGYYWGLYDLPSGACREEYHTYAFAPEGNLWAKVYFNNCLFEAVYTAPHGMTLSYRRKGERYIPCYGHMEAGQKTFVKKIEDCLLPYIRRFAKTWRGLPDERMLNGDRHVVCKLFEQFMGRPSRSEAEVFGSLPFSDDVLEGKAGQLAAPLTEEELRAHHFLPKLLLMTGRKKGLIRESAWYEGSAVRSGKRVRRHLHQYRLYQAARQLRKMYHFQREREREHEGRATT